MTVERKPRKLHRVYTNKIKDRPWIDFYDNRLRLSNKAELFKIEFVNVG